jgi:hypothetical protein
MCVFAELSGTILIAGRRLALAAFVYLYGARAFAASAGLLVAPGSRAADAGRGTALARLTRFGLCPHAHADVGTVAGSPVSAMDSSEFPPRRAVNVNRLQASAAQPHTA